MPALVQVSIDPRDMAEAQRRLNPGHLYRLMLGGVRESTETIRDDVKDLMTDFIDTGRAHGSIYAATQGRTIDTLYGIVSSPLEYVAYLEYGRAPGKMPPVSAIQAWASRRLGDSSFETAFLIARAIGRRGLPAHRMFQTAFERGLGKIRRIMVTALGRL